AVGTREMKDLFHINQLSHDLGLVHISRNAVEHENVDIRLEFVAIDGGVDRFFPEFDRDVVRNELTFARIFQKRLPDFGARIYGPKDVAARAMIEARDRSERLALGPFAAAGRAKQNKRAVFHESDPLYRTRGQSGRETIISQRPD